MKGRRAEPARYMVALACRCTIMVTSSMDERTFMASLPPSLHCATHRRNPIVDARPVPLTASEEAIAAELLAAHRAQKRRAT